MKILRDEVVVTIIATDFERPAAPVVVAAKEEVQEIQPREELSFVEPVKEEEHVCAAAPVVKEQEEMIEPLPLHMEMEAQEADLSAAARPEPVEGYAREGLYDQADTFGCAVDSKDLDIPTFMRQK